jgi:hypothetical protein
MFQTVSTVERQNCETAVGQFTWIDVRLSGVGKKRDFKIRRNVST